MTEATAGPTGSAPPPVRRLVTGTVTDDGRPAAAGTRVELASRRLRSASGLGETRTGNDGRYRLEYEPPAGPAALVVRVSSPDGRSAEASCPAPGSEENLDVTLPADPRSEYARLLTAVTPLLDGADPAGLTPEEAGFLGHAAGCDAAHVRLFAGAARLAGTTGQSPELFYGLLRRGFPDDVGELALRRTSAVREALAAAVELRLIDSADGGEEFLAALRARQLGSDGCDGSERAGVCDGTDVSERTDLPERIDGFDGSADGTPPSALARLFTLTIADPQVRRRLFCAHLDHDGPRHASHASLLAVDAPPDTTARLHLALELSRVADGHPELVGALLERFDSGELTHPRELVRLDGHWEGLVAEAGGPPHASAPAFSPSEYAGELRSRVERTYPTAYVAHRLATAPEPDTAPAARFLTANPDFDLLSTPVDSRSVPDEEARPELAAIQRVYRVAPRFEAMRALRDQGFSSSSAIAGVARTTFAERMAGHLDEAEAHAVHARALRVHAAAVNLVADLRTAGQFDVPWLPPVEAHTDLVPDWGELFGSADQCSCKECRTLYSQPAYLVDLLYFLKRAPSAGSMGELGESPMADTLYARRPDLWHVELSCDNTNLTLPYIDLVNEVLENAIVQDPATADRRRQSSGDPAHLRIQPQWTNHGAYNRLASALYPWSLPYDLWADRARSYLGLLGVRREELMATLHPAGADSVEVVAESLGITLTALRMITGEATGPGHTLAAFYGKPSALPPDQLLDSVSSVRAMLDTAQLEYPELEAVLDTRFVDPVRSLVIEPTDPDHPCDTRLLRINGLTTDTLDRLHRFERLRRVLGWPAHRLDRVIATCTPGELTAATLSCVVGVRRLSERFGLPVERLLCLFGPLDTHPYRTGDDLPLYDRLFLDDTVIVAVPGSRNPFTLNPSRTEVESAGDLRAYPVSAALLSGLEVTDAELTTLVTGPRAVVADTRLTLANLSALVRTVTLARALRLPVADLLRLFELRGGSPTRPGGRAPDGGGTAGDGETELPAGRPVRLRPSPVEDPGPRGTSAGAGGGLGEPPAAGDSAASVRASLADTARFADEVEAIAAGGLAVAEADAVLTATTGPEGSTVPSDAALGSTLTALRSALRAVYEQTAQTTDDKGVLTGRHLSLLGWDAVRVEQAVATLLGTVVYCAPVANDIGARPYPPDLPVRFEPGPDGQGMLRFTGPMTLAQRDRMYDLGSGELWGIIVRKLFSAPRQFVATQMNAYRIPVHRTPLTTMPAGLALPPELVGKVFHDPSAQTLCSLGHRSQDEIDALIAASGDGDFQRAVHLLQGVQNEPVGGDNAFLDASHADTLFNEPQAPADRFRHVLSVLLPQLRRQLSETTVKLQLSQATGLDAACADALLGTWLRALSEPGPLVLDFLAPAFVGSDRVVAVTRTGFPVQFTALSLLYRVALALSRLRVTGEELPWVMGYAAGAGWLDLAALPVSRVEGASPLYRPFVRLLGLLALRDTLPGGSGTLGAVLAAGRGPGASGDRVFDTLSERTGWNRDDVEVLCAAGMLEITLPGELGDERGLGRLRTAVSLLRRLGVSAVRAAAWIPSELPVDMVQSVVMAAKARFSPEDWLTAAVPVADALRERQRTALVSYLVAYPLTTSVGFPFWKDVNGLFDHFLLDVEMGGCRLTTRMAQAIYTVQLFVQRVLLGLEVRVQPGDDETWEQWEWMKRYRLWEANQKVFLYPENYFQPDLRAGASPFFASLRSELMQKEVVGDTMEEVYRNYVDRLDSVARLHPCGIVHDLSSGVEVVHLFACTDSAPRIFHHRRWIKNRTTWTPWEKIELDLDTPALVPFVWNKRLHLMWPTFVKSGDPQAIKRLPDPMVKDSAIEQPQIYWKTQLNWTQYANGGWQPKRITQQSLDTFRGWWPMSQEEQIAAEADPFLTTGRYRLYPQLGPDGELVVWSVYNLHSSVFPDPRGGVISGAFRFGPRPGSVTIDPTVLCYDGTPEAAARGQLFIWPTDTQSINNEFVQHPEPHAPPGYRGKVHLPELFHFYGSDPVLENPLGTAPFRLQLPVSFASPQGWLYDSATFTDGARSYHIAPDLHSSPTRLRFTAMYHPHVDLFLGLLNRDGTRALLDRSVQLEPGAQWPLFDFRSYAPTQLVSPDYPSETEVDFTPEGTYADYNWELFFHIPLLMAQRLSANQRFAEAQQWFHKIFDPTSRAGGRSPARYWITKPFYLQKDYQRQRIEDILKRLAEGDAGERRRVEEWLADPFQPDVVAKFRTTAYQKAVVMRYLDNLISWGDHLFREGTLESLNLATQMYVLAAELLGPRPVSVPPPNEPAPLSYAELRARDAAAPDPVTAAEHLIPVGGTQPPPAGISPGLGLGWLGYFRIPPNDKLLGYWDTVEDRLYKIRHCQDIDGVRRAFELFGAPIDPALLVGAVATGAGLESVAEDLGGPLPHYRFTTMVAKAREYTAEVKSFGAQLLAALEKRDAEALARLRSSHETALLDAVRDVRNAQVTEAAHTLAGLRQARAGARKRQEYYATRDKMNAGEKTHEALSWSGIGTQTIAAAVDMTVSVMRLLPELKIGSPTTIGATWGGTNLGEALKGLSGSLSQIAGTFHSGASLAATLAGYERRSEEWEFQKGQADGEISNYDAQIDAAVVRHEIARRELANHDLQAAHTREADRFLHDKYTGQELYDWMVGQLSTSYFQAYQLAYETAKRAEQAMRYELGADGPQLVRFGHWDTLRKGLLAGERLASDLNRLDAAYLAANAREFELTKAVSLAQLDPNALLTLKETGSCYVSLPEALFDLDTPGHYLRRIKTVGFTVPCVGGPYTSVNLTATLLRSSVRTDPRLPGNRYARQTPDARFRDYSGPVQSVVTSTGQDDSGLFETSLRDERFLPFEGAGVIGEWRLGLPREFRQFDYESIADVVMHLRYTARDGGADFADRAVSELRDGLNGWLHAHGGKGLLRAFSARRELGDQWYRFVSGTSPELRFAVSKRWFPRLFGDDGITLADPQIVLVLSTDLAADGTTRYVDCYGDGAGDLTVTLTSPGGHSAPAPLTADPQLKGQPRARFDVEGQVAEHDEDWVVTMPLQGLDPRLRKDGGLHPDAVVDLLLVWQYEVTRVP
ncbi:neuraminidase-like domain-containing protein [Streptomyces sp. NPDC048349]|uniref:Tc toxin subunit A-related protein n=1 Tax=Streptomyces sp. NPDC048349 TaxID=3155486 RepID=UPI0034312DDA